MSKSTEPQFLPLELEETHFDELWACWLRRRQALFSTLPSRRASQRVDSLIKGHLQALIAHPEKALPLALLKLSEGWGPTTFAAVSFLLNVAPEELFSPQGTLLVDRVHFPIVDAFRYAPSSVARFLSDEDPRLLDGCSMHVPVEEAMLLRALHASDSALRRSAVLAASRHPPGSARLWDALGTLALKGEAGECAVALYGLGMLRGARGLEALGPGLWEHALQAPGAMACLALFGGSKHVSVLLELARAHPARADIIHALGLTGRPSVVEWLQEAAHQGSREVRPQARHALYLITGVPAADTQTPPPKFRSEAADERWHLGRALRDRHPAGTELPPSHQWLAALHSASAPPVPLRYAVPDWLWGEGYAPEAWPRLSLGPLVWREDRA